MFLMFTTIDIQVEGAVENPSKSVISTILSNLTQVTDTNGDDVALYDKELQLVTITLENITVISENITIDDDQKQVVVVDYIMYKLNLLYENYGMVLLNDIYNHFFTYL